MNCHDTRERLSDFALGLLPVDEANQIEQHLETGCNACHEELAEVRDALHLLVESEPLKTPPPALKSTVLDRIDDTQVTPRDGTAATSAKPTRWVGVVAAGLAAVVLGSWYFVPGDSPGGDPSQLAVQQWQQQIEGANRQLGLATTSLVSMQLATPEDRRTFSYLLFDTASNELHVWTHPQSGSTDRHPNHVWLLDEQDTVVGSAPLVRRGDRLASVVALSGFQKAKTLQLLLTRESETLGDSPSDDLVERTTLRVD